MRPSLRRLYLVGGLCSFVLLCAAIAGPKYFRGDPTTTLTVTTTADSGAGSLRDTIAAANHGNTVQFDPALNGQTISLTSGELAIDKNLTIDGPGPSQLAISGSTKSRIFHVMPGRTVTIAGLAIRDGGGNAGDILNDHASLTINNCTIRDGNTGSVSGLGKGGGIYNDGSSGSATLVITNSLITANFATGYGGGIYN